MGKFAQGKYALGVSDRSGFVYKLNDMRLEWTGSLVGPDEWEKKQPQLDPRKHITDPQALKNSRPNTPMVLSIYVGVPLVEDPNLRNLTAFGQVGQVTVNSVVSDVTVSLTGIGSTSAVGSVSATPVTSYAVTVVSTGYGNKYYIDGVQQATLTLNEGSTYRLDQSAGTNNNHPLRFSTTSNGTWSGGTEYTTGVTVNGIPGNPGAYTEIEVATGAPTLYYYCTNHSGMGGQANTP